MLRKVVKAGCVALVCALVGVVLHDYWWRCSSDGLSKEAALTIANEKLSNQDKQISTDHFVLKSAQKEGSDWLFTYSAENCTLDIVINKCGVADIGGMTQSC